MSWPLYIFWSLHHRKLLTRSQKTYKGYKDMLPVYKQADRIRQNALDKDAQINELKTQLASAKVVQFNATSSDDSKYWKHKYESLLANLG
jgi:hypothetical protein